MPRLALPIALLLSSGCAASGPDPWPPPPQCLALEDAWERATCLQPWLEDLVRLESARYAVCRAGRLQLDGTIDDCHVLAHAIGETNLAFHDGDAGRAFATCGTGCIEGCLHGVMEAHVPTLSDDVASARAAVLDLCDEIDADDRYACVHGIGHGLRHHGFLSLLDAIAVCDASPDHDWANICIGGVLMEHVETVLPATLDNLGPVLPQICADLEGDPWLEHCLAAIGEGLMFRTGHDLERSNELCLRLADAEHIAECQHGAETEAEVVTKSDPIRGDCD